MPLHYQGHAYRAGSRITRLILPVVPGLAIPTGLPQCPALRGEPCRTYTGP